MQRTLFALALSAAYGCAAPDDPSAPVDPEPVPGDVLSASMGPIEVAAGVERTECITVSLGNDEPAMIRGIETTLSSGSHHMIITRAVDEPDEVPRPCGAFGVAGDTLFIAEKAEAELRYPAGAGLQIDAQQSIGIEIHYINTASEGTIDVTGTVEFELAPVDVSLRPVALLFTGELSLTLPPMSETVVTSFHDAPAGAEIFALTSHTHQYGTYASIHRAQSPEDTTGELLHESLLWSEPPLDVFDPPFVLSPGEGLKLTCQYFNPTIRTINFGTSALDEMCFLWAHYVPPE